MSDLMQDFQSDAVVQPKRKFAMVKTIVNPVKLESGASYTIADCFDKNGAPHLFKGKRLLRGNEKRSTLHVILFAVAVKRDGSKYSMFRDWVMIDDAFKNVLRPSLIKVFGAQFGKVMQANSGVFLPMCLEEIPHGKYEGSDGLTHNRTTWRVAVWYDSEQTMRQQERAYFAQFGDEGDGNGVAQNTSGIPEVAIQAAKNLYKLINNDETFKTVIAQDATYNVYPFDRLLAAVKA